MPEPIVYLAHERPDVEVLWEGAWCPGELRMQRHDAAGQRRTHGTAASGDCPPMGPWRRGCLYLSPKAPCVTSGSSTRA